MKKQVFIELVAISQQANDWVTKHSLVFRQNKKSHIEYLQTLLFDHSVDVMPIISEITDLYDGELSKAVLYYRKIELLAYQQLVTKSDCSRKIEKIFTNGFFIN